jgi:hypothetical protein
VLSETGGKCEVTGLCSRRRRRQPEQLGVVLLVMVPIAAG